MAPGLYCATQRTQNLKGFPGSGCRPQAALRRRCYPSVPQGPARPPPRAELSASSLHISATPAPHPRGPRSSVLRSPARPGAQSRPSGAPSSAQPRGRVRASAASRMLTGLRSRTPPDLRWTAVGPGPPDRPSPPPESKPPGAALPGSEEGADPGEVTPKVPKLGGGVHSLSGALGHRTDPVTDRPWTAPPRPKSSRRGSPARPPPGQGGGAHPAFGRPGLQLAAPASGSGCGSRAPGPSAGRRGPRGWPVAERPAGRGILAAAARGLRVPLVSVRPRRPPLPLFLPSSLPPSPDRKSTRLNSSH